MPTKAIGWKATVTALKRAGAGKSQKAKDEARRLLKPLSPSERAAFLQVELKGKAQSEAALVLGCSMDEVFALCDAAKKKLGGEPEAVKE